jgi:hypothetical protein
VIRQQKEQVKGAKKEIVTGKMEMTGRIQKVLSRKITKPPRLKITTEKSSEQLMIERLQQIRRENQSKWGPGRPRPYTHPYKRPRPRPRPRKGIIIGAKVSGSTIYGPPECAFWMPNREDERFGRLFVKFGGCGRYFRSFRSMLCSDDIAVSKVMFADSFHRARSVLLDEFGKEPPLQDGEELVLMNIDLYSQANKQALNVLRAKAETTEQNNSVPEDQTQQIRMFSEFVLKPESEVSVPLSISLHPAISGSELAWSAARVDIWFYQMDLLSEETAAINGGRPIPTNLRNIPISDASIWIFHERDSVIEMVSTINRKIKLLKVNSNRRWRPQNKTTSHFEISMFATLDNAPLDTYQRDVKLHRLPKLSYDTQQLVDWLSTNHHDFMRLNDFSEALSLLRWLRARNAALTVIEIDEQSRPIVTPDHVIISKGPCVKNQ